MKRSLLKKTCALALAIIMVFSMIPTSVFALDGTDAPDNNAGGEGAGAVAQSVTSAEELEAALASAPFL